MKVTFTVSLLNVVGFKGDHHSVEENWYFYDNQGFQMYSAFEINSFFGFTDLTSAISFSPFV